MEIDEISTDEVQSFLNAANKKGCQWCNASEWGISTIYDPAAAGQKKALFLRTAQRIQYKSMGDGTFETSIIPGDSGMMSFVTLFCKVCGYVSFFHHDLIVVKLEQEKRKKEAD